MLTIVLMRNAWTGGQYSLYRVHASPLFIAAAVVALFFTIGLYDRIAAIAIACLLLVTSYRIFGRTKDACPLMPPDLRSRFF